MPDPPKAMDTKGDDNSALRQGGGNKDGMDNTSTSENDEANPRQSEATTMSTTVDEATLDSKIAMKIVRQRIEDAAIQDSAVDSDAAPTKEEPTCSSTTNEMESSTPGAVRVRGIDATSQQGEFSTDLEMQSPPPSMPFEPSTPIEASLVEKRRNTDPSCALVVEAEPMQESSIKDALRSWKLFALAGCCVVVLLAVGITLGIVLGLEVGSADDKSKNPLGTPPPPPPFPPPQPPKEFMPPFSTQLASQYADQIRKDPSGPYGQANEWIWRDPNVNELSIERQLARYSLAVLYYSLDGPNWNHRDGWLDYNVHECDWYFSHPQQQEICDEQEQIVILNLSSNALYGPLTGDLTLHLPIRTLDLANNSLTQVPSRTFVRATRVTHLDVSHNLLEGYLGLSLGWTNEQLTVLRANHNQLKGNIEKLFSAIPNVIEIDLSNNLFDGGLPGGVLPNSTGIQILNLANNRFSGTLSRSLGNLTELEHLNVSDNTALTGTLPSELSMLVSLKTLDLTNTSLMGAIPEELCNNAELDDVWMDAESLWCEE